MTNFSLKKISPLTIILSWVTVCILFTIIIFYIIGVSTPGGEQKPLTFLSVMLNVLVYGVMFFSVLTIFIYPEWVRKNWFINVFFFCSSGVLIFLGTKNHVTSQYASSVVKVKIDNKDYLKKIEYYDNNFQKIRSVSFTLNNKKDSLWTTYSENGSIIKQEKYKADTLIQTIIKK